ncbi:glycosyltransferase [Methanolobus tindarius DSM 2278]|uniref:Glycosyltransferase n=1 Tax=Methanolobus tindarius DSM 2278 TaxID=1090322 RepID=W9DSZ5_METTI|nr:glycosyltransferase [Methanolobus tindarius]ETA66807.1 glycosyltransferase [Methanolobus tindarius DSM 2278]
MTDILMLITTLTGGGAERVPSELSISLDKRISRRIILLKNQISYPYDQKPISMNLNYTKSSFFSVLYALTTGILKYRKIVKTHNAKVSISFLVMDNFINILSNLFKKRTKVIISVHATLSNKFKDTIIDKIAIIFVKKLYNRADLIIAVSEGVKEELISMFHLDSQKIKVVYNPLNISQIKFLKEETVDDLFFSDSVPTIITMGRLNEVKGQWHLIRAFSKVKSKQKCRLCILGEGPMRPRLEKLISDLNLKDDILLLGWKTNPYKYINHSSLFVLTSISEALPYSIIEAMACGCPVISTDCKYGPSEIIGDNKYGILVPPMDSKFCEVADPLTIEENILAENIIQILNDENNMNKYSELGLKRSMNFDTSKVIDIYEQIFFEDM